MNRQRSRWVDARSDVRAIRQERPASVHAQLQGAALERDGEHVRLRLRAVAGGLVVVLLRKLERGFFLEHPPAPGPRLDRA